MNSAFNDTRIRWDLFLSKIEMRFHDMLSQSETLLPNILELRDFDLTPFYVAWQGIEGQSKELISKINDTWREKVSPVFDEIKDVGESEIDDGEGSLDEYYGNFYKQYNLEQRKGPALANQLERAFKGYEVRTFASAARVLQKKAREILGKTFSCTQCKAPLPVRQNFFRSYYETCTYCQTVNTFEPGTIARNVEHFALHALAEEKAIKEYYAYKDIEEKFISQRDDEPQSIDPQKVLDAYTVYAEHYLKARIAIIPDLEAHYEKDLVAKIEHVRKWVLGKHGWEYTNPLDMKIDSTNEEDSSDTDSYHIRTITITRELIKTTVWQMVRFYYPEGGTLDGRDNITIKGSTVLTDLEDSMDFILDEIDKSFGIYIDESEVESVDEIIKYLLENRDDITIHDNIDDDGNWVPRQE